MPGRVEAVVDCPNSGKHCTLPECKAADVFGPSLLPCDTAIVMLADDFKNASKRVLPEDMPQLRRKLDASIKPYSRKFNIRPEVVKSSVERLLQAGRVSQLPLTEIRRNERGARVFPAK